MTGERSGNSVLIAVATRNRRKITELSLLNLVSVSFNCDILVWDDHSSEYSVEWLKKLVPSVLQAPKRCGIHALRGIQLSHFLWNTNYERIYLTDTDVIHDPNWQVVAEELLLRHKNPVCLYNTMFHGQPMEARLTGPNPAYERMTCPGVSVYLCREMVESVSNWIDQERPENSFRDWDFDLMNRLLENGYRFTHSMISYLEHYGAGGLHNSDNFGDTAVLPTHNLKRARDLLLPYLLTNSEVPDGQIIESITRFGINGAFNYKGFSAQQSQYCHGAFQLFLNLVRPTRIVEIGTGGGGFTRMLFDILTDIELADNCQIISVDCREQPCHRALAQVGIRQILLDIESVEARNLIAHEIRGSGVTVVLCDGGNKAKDFSTFAGVIKDGDFIFAHDFSEDSTAFQKHMIGRLWNWCEITRGDVLEPVRNNQLQDSHRLLFSPIAWLCMRKMVR